MFGIDAGLDTEQVKPACNPCGPTRHVVRHLEVANPHDPARGGGDSGVVHKARVFRGRGDAVEGNLRRERRVLTDQPGHGQPQAGSSGAVEPHRVEVVTHHHCPTPREGEVERFGRWSVGPQGVLETATNNEVTAAVARREQRNCLGRGTGSGHIDEARLPRPLREVDVRVPQARHDPAAVEVEFVCPGNRVKGAPHRGDAPVDNGDVNEPAVTDHSRAAKNQRTHDATLWRITPVHRRRALGTRQIALA